MSRGWGVRAAVELVCQRDSNTSRLYLKDLTKESPEMWEETQRGDVKGRECSREKGVAVYVGCCWQVKLKCL